MFAFSLIGLNLYATRVKICILSEASWFSSTFTSPPDGSITGYGSKMKKYLLYRYFCFLCKSHACTNTHIIKISDILKIEIFHELIIESATIFNKM